MTIARKRSAGLSMKLIATEISSSPAGPPKMRFHYVIEFVGISLSYSKRNMILEHADQPFLSLHQSRFQGN